MHRTTPRFWKLLEDLPEAVQKSAHESFQLLRANSRHPSLHFKKVGEFWSARVGLTRRALAVPDDEDFIWVWIGAHDEYERMIGS